MHDTDATGPAPRRTRLRPLAAVLLVFALAAAPLACGGGGDGAGGPEDEGAGTSAAAELPVSPPSGPVDEQLAEKGEKLFRSRGCISCHTVGEGRRVGPDLEGVTERRDFAWTYHMVTNPDSMVKNDSVAKRLLAEYMTPMADQNVRPEQFRAIYEYLREESDDAGGE